MPYSLEEVKSLIAAVSASGVSEFELESEGFRLKLRKPELAMPRPVADGATLSVPSTPPPGAPKVVIPSPMVGTFYRASAPDAPPFVDVGDRVKPGQVVCIIEAMKLMNEIESEVSGRVARILIENGASAEYGQPLFEIEPD